MSSRSRRYQCLWKCTPNISNMRFQPSEKRSTNIRMSDNMAHKTKRNTLDYGSTFYMSLSLCIKVGVKDVLGSSNDMEELVSGRIFCLVGPLRGWRSTALLLANAHKRRRKKTREKRRLYPKTPHTRREGALSTLTHARDKVSYSYYRAKSVANFRWSCVSCSGETAGTGIWVVIQKNQSVQTAGHRAKNENPVHKPPTLYRSCGVGD